MNKHLDDMTDSERLDWRVEKAKRDLVSSGYWGAYHGRDSLKFEETLSALKLLGLMDDAETAHREADACLTAFLRGVGRWRLRLRR